MKIMQVIPALGLGGAERMVCILARELQARGHDVSVLSLYENRTELTEEMESGGVSVRYCGKRRGLDLRMITRLQRIFADEKPDVVHTHQYALQYTMPAAGRAGVPVKVHTLHSVARYENGHLNRMLNGWYFRRNDCCPVAVCNAVQASAAEEYALPLSRIPVVYNGIDMQRSNAQPVLNASTRQKAEEGTRYVSVGRLTEVKNHDALLRAFARHREAFPKDTLHIFGSGPQEETVGRVIAELGLQDVVRVIGGKLVTLQTYEQYDVFVLPSKIEGFPLVLLEAMACGKAIIATDVGGIPEMLKDGESALLLQESQPETIAAAMHGMSSHDDLRQRLGANAYRRSAAFSAGRMAAEYEALYTGLAKRP